MLVTARTELPRIFWQGVPVCDCKDGATENFMRSAPVDNCKDGAAERCLTARFCGWLEDGAFLWVAVGKEVSGNKLVPIAVSALFRSANQRKFHLVRCKFFILKVR